MRCSHYFTIGEADPFGNGHESAATGNAAQSNNHDHGIASVRVAPALRRNACDTSREAARSMERHASTQRLRVLAYIRSRGPDGATDAEICSALGLNSSSVNPRRGELADLGLIVLSGTYRLTPSKRRARVWLAVECAQAAIGGGA
jgi:hypothetical protein